MVFNGKKDDEKDKPEKRQRVKKKTPKDLFEETAFKERATLIEPGTGDYQNGYNNIDSIFYRGQIGDSGRNALAISSVDVLRAGTSKDILRNDRNVRKEISSYIDKERINNTIRLIQINTVTLFYQKQIETMTKTETVTI